MNPQNILFRKRNRKRKRQVSYIQFLPRKRKCTIRGAGFLNGRGKVLGGLSAIFYLLAVPALRAEEGLFPVFPSGYLSTFDRSVFISGSRGTYLGSTDEDGNFIALGNRGGRSAFGRINEDGTVIILYNPADQDP